MFNYLIGNEMVQEVNNYHKHYNKDTLINHNNIHSG